MKENCTSLGLGENGVLTVWMKYKAKDREMNMGPKSDPKDKFNYTHIFNLHGPARQLIEVLTLQAQAPQPV